jgi:hypothetical protein
MMLEAFVRLALSFSPLCISALTAIPALACQSVCSEGRKRAG